MFYDQVNVKIKAGDGGAGLVSFRRERFVSKGGPDGGDGGKGGDVYFRASPQLSTLQDYVRAKQFRAQSGKGGGKKNMRGKAGEDLVLEIPVGTVVWNDSSGEVIADLQEPHQQILIAKGGRGGFGNAHFSTSRRQAPTFAEQSAPGEELELRLELKLIADVGIIGQPNAGKSTLISVISAARPKIADYPFTTIIPNLGVVTVDGEGFVACDIPGLISGSASGKGLGDEFLRHVERCRILVHMLDATREDLKKDYNDVNKELKLYNSRLARKPQIVVINKIDAVSKERLEKIKKELEMDNIYFISAVSGEGVKELVYKSLEELKRRKRRVVKAKAIKIFRPQEALLENFTIKKEGEMFVVRGKRIEEAAAVSDVSHPVGEARLKKIFKDVKLAEKLVKAGAKKGAKFKVSRRIGKITKDGIVIIQ